MALSLTEKAALHAEFHNALSEICPIDGLSIGRWEDKATWRIDFASEATEEQREAAQSAMQAFE